ncbi:MAG TPA: MoaD/ThiS family protein [Cyclobacteriaceae bacterium]|jgi:molybdopterin synthase sulfur carrier subunit
MMKTLKIKAFGITRDILGGREVELQLNESGTVGDLRSQLSSTYPEVLQLKSLFIAVNNEYADDHVVLNDTDEIALIPPVSGG